MRSLFLLYERIALHRIGGQVSGDWVFLHQERWLERPGFLALKKFGQ